MKRCLLVAIISVLVGKPPIFAANQQNPILESIGVKRGICALLGDPTCELALELARESELLIYIQLLEAKDVAKAREAADDAGFYGTRIFVDKGPLKRLHLADNIADAVVAVGRAKRVPKAEVLRVLRPGGKALLERKVLTKPFPEGLDDWSHPYHGPDNNPQSSDRLARAPYLTQFLAEPWYCPMPEVTVASGGRIFKAFGSRAFKRPQWPMLNKLIAINGYNGTILWERQLDPDFMIHRNTMIATPDTLYLADAVSCKLLDTATGELKDEIKVPADLSDGPVWKWMALKNGTLYALVGEKEPPGDALRGTVFRGAGWPWWNIPKYAWGFGRTILAINPSTKKVLWHHREPEPLDTRAVCMNEDRIFFHSLGKSLGCLDVKTGKLKWKTEDTEAVRAIAQQRPAQRAVWGFATSAYAKCSEDAVYFAGPQQTKLVAVSARDGSLLWQYPEEGNFQLVLREDGLYAMGSNHRSCKFHPMTGKKLLELPNRAACTRATGSVDRIFVRGGGTRCWDVAAGKWLHISPMRPACHDGVIITGGHLYWGPWMCGCNLSLIGVICLGPAGDFDFAAKAAQGERIETFINNPTKVTPLPQTADDWPTYRRDNIRSTRSNKPIASKAVLQWQYIPDTPATCTAPVSVGGLVFVGGSDGVVRALDAADGKPKWTAFTGGAVRIPPTIAAGRALVGSADGWLYAFEAASGRLLWRFRAAPVERKIPIYGTLSSTWPVAAGVLVEDGVAYAAAGIANYDGTHVYALDAGTGRIRWQNNTSGMTAGGQGAGVSVQGDLLLHENRLYLAGGNRVALASYDIADGAFRPAQTSKLGTDRRGPRGHDLFLRRDGSVVVFNGLPWYTRAEDTHYIDQAELESPAGKVAVTTTALSLLPPDRSESAKPSPRSRWTARPFQENVAVAVAKNAVIVAGTDRHFAKPEAAPDETYGIVALDIDSGKPLWRHRLPAGPVRWGLAIDREGRLLVALQNGRVLCIGSQGRRQFGAADRDRQRRREPLLTPAHANVRYGPHERNVLDLYLAQSETPSPLVLYIHGGGFRGGDKQSLNSGEARTFLNAGFSIAAINYRLTDTAPAPAAYLDCARALQFLRHNAAKWNINPKLVASTGGSAGAGTSMWLAFHDNLADTDSDDAVAQQSTRLTCIAVRNGQSSYDPRFAEKIGIPRPNFDRHPFFLPFYDIKPDEIDTPRAYERYEQAAPITYLSQDDPPALLAYNYPNEEVTDKTSLGLIVHHPKFGIALKEQMDKLGIECIVQYKEPKSGELVRHEEDAKPVTAVEFIRKQFRRARTREITE